MRTLIAIATLIAAFAVNAQTATNTPFETWKQWFSGKYPVKSALVQVTYYNTNGMARTAVWFRFGLQHDTYFYQPYIVDTNSTVSGMQLVPEGPIRGASGSVIWSMVGGDMVSAETVTNEFAVGTNHVRDSSAIDQGFIHQALGLSGVDRNTIEWDNLKFTGKSMPEAFSGKREKVSFYITGMTNGTPAEYWFWYGTNGPIKYHLVYSTNLPPGIPILVRREHGPLSPVGPIEMKILDARLGTNDLRETGGYVPSVFSKGVKYLTMYTNAMAYNIDLMRGESTLIGDEPDPFASTNKGKFIVLAAAILGSIAAWTIFRRKSSNFQQ